MTRQELAAQLLRDEAGFDQEAGYDDDTGIGADDPISAAGLSSLSVTLTVANLAAISLKLFTNTDMDAAALPANVSAPTIAGYKSIIKYLMTNPSRLRSILIQSSETNSSGAPLLSSLQIKPSRETPFGLTCSNAVLIQQYQGTGDFNVNRVNVPLASDLDGFSFLEVTSGTNNSGGIVTFTVTMFFGQRVEQRKKISAQSPVRQLRGAAGFASLPKFRR